MPGVMLPRREVDALCELREHEYRLARLVDKSAQQERVHKQRRAVERCQRQMATVHRQREDGVLRRKLERWWRDRTGRAPFARSRCGRMVDQVGIAHVYDDVLVPASSIRTLADVRDALKFAEARAPPVASKHKPHRTPRAVLPPTIAGPLATLQNLPADTHARLALLARWIMNARPTTGQIRYATRKHGVQPYAARLVTFAASLPDGPTPFSR